jgi:response regulator receiver domain-containing protein
MATFNDVAKNIIKESISSAIFIDDKALESFKSKNYSQNFKTDHVRTKGLYDDFKSNQCLLHSFKFTKKGWKNGKRFYLKNKDLLILDWQLIKTDHTEALKILDEAIAEKSMHFICIYTNEEAEVVKNELNKFFWGKVSPILKAELRDVFAVTELNEYLDLNEMNPDWIEADELLDNIINSRDAIQVAEVEAFRERYNLTEQHIQTITDIAPEKKSVSFAKFKTVLSGRGIFSSHLEAQYRPSTNDSTTFYINHTIVKIFKKNEVAGNKLYDSFLTSFINEKNIFLSLMGLEMRNRFRSNSSFIGKDFDDLNEDAFFHHKQKNDASPYIFFDFLREILKDQISSYLYEKDLNLFDVLTDYYYTNNDGANRQTVFNHDNNRSEFINQTFRLNHFYNRLNIKERSKNDFIRFGDIYKTTIVKHTENEPDLLEDKFYLCVTPHCDCLNPKKIDNQFWFIEGKIAIGDDAKKIKTLREADGLYISFVKIDENIEMMYWENSSFECKPKTFFINENKMQNNKVKVKFNEQEYEFTFIESLKENYAQRLANKAFGYPLRVGIDFVKK